MRHAARKVFLHPGEFCFDPEVAHIHTLLGSCVAVTLWHRRLRIGGMCHFVLPRRPAGRFGWEPDGRYGMEALELFRRAAVAAGTRLSDYEAKVFGGGELLGPSPGNPIGPRNVQVAMDGLIESHVPVRVAHVGDAGHRRIVFDLATGDVWVRHQLHDGRRIRSLNGIS